MSSTLKIGIVGLGSMGKNHLRVLQQIPKCEISSVFDVDNSVAVEQSTKYGCRAAKSINDLLEKVDAVIISTPTSTHLEVLALAIGKIGAVFVEKPMTPTAEQSKWVQTLTEDKGVLLQVGYIERFNPVVLALEKLVIANGPPISIDLLRTSRVSSRVKDVDVVSDLMVHDVDLACFLGGDVASVSAVGIVHGTSIELASAMFVHKSGLLTRLHSSRITERKQRLLTATFKNFFVECDLISKTVQIFRQNKIEPQTIGLNSVSSSVEYVELSRSEPLLSELQYFVDSVRNGSQPIPGVAEDVKALKLCDAIREQVFSSSNVLSSTSSC